MQKNILTILLGLSLFLVNTLQAAANDNTDQKIDQLIQKMTIEEKIGQMTLLATYIYIETLEDGSTRIDLDALHEAIYTYKVGAMLNSPESPYTPEQWQQWLTLLQNEVDKTPQKIPMLIGVDSIHGATFMKDATLLPHNLGIGASRNIEAAKLAAEITGKETKAAGTFWNFDPVLDVGRQPLWARFEETFGEDPYIVEKMGVAMVKTYENMGIASTMKHFVGYSAPANGKDRTAAYIPPNMMWQTYLPPFKAAVDAGSASIMINSGSVNNVPLHASPYWLTEVLREQWGFKGLIVSDWEDIKYLHSRHRIAANDEEAVLLAINAGVDMSMVPTDFSFSKILVKLVKEGKVSEQRIDQSVRIILKMKHDIGLFKHPQPNTEFAADFARQEYTEQALDLANESMTLLKNRDGILPLKRGQKVLLAGPAADHLGTLHGSWSYTWQGQDEGVFPTEVKTIRESLEAYLGKDSLHYLGAPAFDAAENYRTKTLIEAAKDVDLIILALGEDAYAEQPGLIDDLNLPQEQIALAHAAMVTGKPLVVVLTQGRPRVIEPIVEGSDAILLAYRPGSRGADAIVQTLYGKNNPSGVLPFSYPRFSGDLMTYDHYALSRIAQITQGNVTEDAYDPQWPFGHGLSYTEFKMSKFKVSPKKFHKGDVVTVSAVIKNTGKRAGKKAVDLYISDHYASDIPQVKRLRRFDKVTLKAGKSTRVEFTLSAEDFSFVNRDLKTVIEPGMFSIELEGERLDLEFVE
ncbi:MAG: beta-glucosidase [Alteromonadaceae bacterium]|nr:MAG: beta-glucosidase [Alteromonadaceae bacterium]